jgi:hypothetical protein
MNNVVGAFHGESFKGLSLSGVGAVGDGCADDHLKCAVLAGVANINEALVRGTTVFGDSQIAVLGLRFPIERATAHFLDNRRTQARLGSSVRTLLRAKGEVVAILKLKGNVISTALRDLVAVRVLLVFENCQKPGVIGLAMKLIWGGAASD